MNFWDNDHPLAADNTRLYDELVPSSGNCKTLQGEMIRAAGRIGYDWYNNGWGCNNWSGAVIFLEKFVPALAGKRTAEETAKFDHALRVVHGQSHGERVHMSDDAADALVTTIIAYVVQCILDNPTLIDNTRDMFDFQEPDAPYEEDDNDGYYEDEEDDE